MAASDILLADDAQDSFTSLSDIIWDLDYQGSGAYDGPAGRELSQRYTSNLALLDYKSPGAVGVELDGRLQQVQPGTAGARVTGFAAEATVRAATQSNIRQVMTYCVLPRKEGARKGLCGSCVQPSVKAVHAAPAPAPIRWSTRKGHVVALSIRRDHEGQGKTNHLVGKETCREFKKPQGIGSK
jgi:CheY-like chemotaxis protein